MLEPTELFELVGDVAGLDKPVLVHALDGFVDAGNAARLTREHLLATLAGHEVVSFDIDQLFDYRARRPDMLFVTDHWESYTPPQLSLHLLRDLADVPFLLLAGPEPDVQWERFIAAMTTLTTRLQVSMVIGLNAIPMGVPHTRPPSVIAHGQPPELVADYRGWLNSVQVPASAGHLLEYRLGQAGIPSVGFTANVPHYLAHLDYPGAAAKLIECVSQTAALSLPAGELDEAAAQTRHEVDEQVEASEQVTAVVRALEHQYDELIAGTGGSLLAEGATLPTADEIGAEFEQYLSRQIDPPEDPG